jgi:Flp pilus assembly pilin Flp
MFRRCNLRADESGQTFVEWLGLMAFIVVLVGLVIAAAPGLAHKISDLLGNLIDALPV